MNAHDHQSLAMLIRERVAEIAAFEPEEITERALMNPLYPVWNVPPKLHHARSCVPLDPGLGRLAVMNAGRSSLVWPG